MGAFAMARAPAFLMALREPRRQSLPDELMDPRLERPIGVISRPESELASQNFKASLPRQFDGYVWFDRTRPIATLGDLELAAGETDTYPLGLSG